MNKKRLLLLIPFAAAALVGCTPSGGDNKQCDSAVVTVDRQTATLGVGETLRLNATISVEGCSIDWESDSESVATVENGIVTAHAVGTAHILANGKSVCTVTVTPAATEYTPDKVIEKCDAAGSGVVVNEELIAVGVAENTSKDKNGWKGNFKGSNLKFESVTTSETFDTLDGYSIKIKGYAELYNGDYKIGYLPPSASPTGEKYNPSLVSATPDPSKEVESVVGVKSAPTQVEKDGTIDPATVQLNVKLADGSDAVRSATRVECDTSTVKTGVTATAYYKSVGSATFTVEVIDETNYGTADHPITTSEAQAIMLRECSASSALTKKKMYCSGTVSRFVQSFDYGAVEFYFTDGTTEVYVYRMHCTAEEAAKIKVGAVVELEGFGKYDSRNPEAYGHVAFADNSDKQCKVISITPAQEKEVAEVLSVADGHPTEVFVGAEIPLTDVLLNVRFTDGETGTVNPTNIDFDNTKEAKNVEVTCSYNEVGSATFNIDVNGDPVIGKTFTKISSDSELTEGTYLIADTTDKYVFGGKDVALDAVKVDGLGDEITGAEGMAAIKIEEMTGGYSLKVLTGVNAGKYMVGTSGSNTLGFKDEPQLNTISLNNGKATIVSNTSTFRFNNASNQLRFRYYTSATNLPSLYKFDDTEPAELVSISVDSSQVKKEYYVGDSLDTTNLVVTAHYDDESEKVITSGYTIDPESFEEAKNNVAVTISYNGKNAEPFNVKVSPRPTLSTVSIDADEMKTEYFVGDKVDLTGVKVIGHYSDTTEHELKADEYELTVNPETVAADTEKVKLTATPVDTKVAAVDLDVNITISTGVLFDFSFEKIGTTGWTSGYLTHTVEFADADVKFSGASKQTGTITDIPVQKGGTVEVIAKNDKTIKNVSASFRQWSAKTQSISLEVSTDGGANYTPVTGSYDNFAYPKTTLDEGVNAIKFVLSNSSNQVGIEKFMLSFMESAPAELQEIYVSTELHRDFYLNDEFVPETIMAKYDKGEDVDVTDKAVFEDYDMETAGKQTVKVTYGEKETSYDITVSEAPAPAIKSISINADGMLKEYYDKDDIDLTGVKVYAHYESGDPVELDASKYSLTCSPEKADIESKKTTLTATLLDTEAGVEPATLDVNLTVTEAPVTNTSAITKATDFPGGSYAANNYERFSTDGSGLAFESNQVSIQQENIQFQSKAGKVWTTSPITGGITKIEFSSTSEVLEVYVGSTLCPTADNGTKLEGINGVYTVTSGTYAYMSIINGDATSIISSDIVISYNGTIPEYVIPVHSITLSDSKVELLPGGTKQVTASVLPSNVTDKSVIWSVENESKEGCVTVSSTGLITGAKEGTATVVCTSVLTPSVKSEIEVVVSSSVVSPDVVYTFPKADADSTKAFDANETLAFFKNNVSSGDNLITDAISTKMYQGINGAKLGASKDKGSVTLTTSAAISKLIIRAMVANGDSTVIIVNGKEITLTGEMVDYVVELTAPTTTISIAAKNASKNRFYIGSLSLFK